LFVIEEHANNMPRAFNQDLNEEEGRKGVKAAYMVKEDAPHKIISLKAL
jgi:hypothetical protein